MSPVVVIAAMTRKKSFFVWIKVSASEVFIPKTPVIIVSGIMTKVIMVKVRIISFVFVERRESFVLWSSARASLLLSRRLSTLLNSEVIISA